MPHVFTEEAKGKVASSLETVSQFHFEQFFIISRYVQLSIKQREIYI